MCKKGFSLKATLKDITRLTDTTDHHAFTDLCQWQGRYYCAYRVAQSHNIVPPGRIVIQCLNPAYHSPRWIHDDALEHPVGDMRDPKFLVTPDVLYCMCGIYLPHPAYNQSQNQLMASPADNILQTHITYTTDGESW